MVAIGIRVPQIRSDAKRTGSTNFAEALARVFEDPTISDTEASLTARLTNILDASADPFNGGLSHFSGIFRDWADDTPQGRRGDTGFKPCFQDFALWPGSSMQVGHFMTAVDMGFRPNKVHEFIKAHPLPGAGMGAPFPDLSELFNDPNAPKPNWWSESEDDCVTLIIAHEQVPDSGVYGQEPSFWNKVQTFTADVSHEDLATFRNAFNGLGQGPQHDTDKALATISAIKVGNGSGNSKQDLLLSLFGFKFGTMIRKGELKQIAEGGNWVRVNLKDPSGLP